MYSVPLRTLFNEFNLSFLTDNVPIDDMVITQPNINRPALQLAGFFDYFSAERLQIIGMVEHNYLLKHNDAQRQENLRRIFEYKVPCIVICRGLKIFPEMQAYAEQYNVPVFGFPSGTTDFIGELIPWLKVQLAPRISIHGCLLDVYGAGILITGESGIGKSEMALELIKRGHRFVADDLVEIKRVSQGTLVGSCPERIRYFLELRGIGIIDVQQMFGIESIKATQSIDLVIKLELWDGNKTYDRLGTEEEYTEILGNKVMSHTIPVRPGRNLAVICEAAAINRRQRKMGYNAALSFTEKIMRDLGKG
ncbi:MAG: HPr(Ser) kinase/phosphatase [Defluviitaleaceae bacterium]|nr:HPr(Ser) kinase/phosphatase [Defluviitaleaceae bacterium]